jgi:hypothetical protein
MKTLIVQALPDLLVLVGALACFIGVSKPFRRGEPPGDS